MIFHLFIVLAKEAKEYSLISSLIGRGYSVSPCAGELLLSTDDTNHAIFSAKIERAEIDQVVLYEEMMGIIAQHRISHYALLITPFADESIWGLGNSNTNKAETKIAKTVIN